MNFQRAPPCVVRLLCMILNTCMSKCHLHTICMHALMQYVCAWDMAIDPHGSYGSLLSRVNCVAGSEVYLILWTV